MLSMLSFRISIFNEWTEEAKSNFPREDAYMAKEHDLRAGTVDLHHKPAMV